MHLDHYKLEVGTNSTIFEFVSEGKRGSIIKVVQYQLLDTNLYNLAFGDKDRNTESFDDYIITDNGDAAKVLATVVNTVYAFTQHHLEAWVYATGSTEARTRLYQMGINKYFEMVIADFEILGEQQDEWERYEKGKSYQAFAVRRKSVNLNDENNR